MKIALGNAANGTVSKGKSEGIRRWFRKHVNKYAPGKWLWSLFRLGLIIGLAYVILYPLLIKISLAFMEQEDMYDMSVRWIPRHITLENFEAVDEILGYWKYFWTTLGYSAAATVIQVIFTALAAYGLARFQFRGRKLLYFLVILTMVIPPQTYITASYRQFRYFDFFGIGKIFGMQPISLINTPWPLLILSIGCCAVKNGLFVFILQQFFRNMPVELDEAACVDGAGPLRIFTRIALPNAVPALTTVTVFAFVWNWNDLYTASTYTPQFSLFSLALSRLTSLIELSVGGGGIVTDPMWISHLSNAAALMIQLPLLIFFLIAQKFFVEGVERTGLTGM